MHARVVGLSIAVLTGLARADDRARAEPDASEITVTIDAIDRVRAPGVEPGLGYVSGRALAHPGELELFDVMFVIDTSGSTATSSGLGEGSSWLRRLPGLPRRRGDSILGAEVAAIESLLGDFDPRTTRVGLVSFAGSENPHADSAWVEAPLTSDYAQMRQALADRLLVDPEGGTNLRAGLLRGAIELLGTRSAESTPRKNAARHLVVLTDGLPTLPERNPEGGAIRAARSLAKRGVRAHVFEIGTRPRDRSRAGPEVARITHGEHHAVSDLAELAPLLGQIEFRALRELRVANRTTGAKALELVKDDDGEYAALVPVLAGTNRIEVVAIASDGRERRVEREIVFSDTSLDARQRARQERLLALHGAAGAREKAARAKTLAVEPERTEPPPN
ncbi:MAG: vWA domain-containing protein [Myxococcota bacterium]